MQRVSSVTNHFRGSASTTANDAPVLFNYTGNVCKVTLNRPKHLNALNVEMDKLLRSELRKWNQSSNPKVAIFSGAGGKSFSAGGDVKSLHEAGGRGDYAFFDEFYREEYGAILDCAKMKPIQVSLWDGFVMGAGAAISVYAPIKIATEKAVFAMPEAKIGLFTDVSAGYFLSRLRSNIGVFLALTATRLKGEELVQVGIADHFVRSEKLPSLEREIIENTTSKTTLEDLKAIVRKYEEPVERKYKNEEFIQATFGKSSVEEIHNTLKQATQNKEFANELVGIMESMPPLSLKIMLEQMQRGRKLNLGEVLAMEMRIVHRFMREKDFYEGVRCTLINKGDKPKWSHKSLTDVSKEEVEQHFNRLPEHQEFNY